ncbi:hypothetical protein [Haliea atlantica]|jgi:archaellum component FlaC|tara:strand:+ start:92423 stop:93220 length:798 start_codon:yes stop_codon:yes gene_type:complete
MAQDDLDHIPSIVPGRDDDDPAPVSRPRGARSEASPRSGSRGSGGGRGGSGSPPGAGGGGSRAGIAVAVLALLLAAGAAFWAWQLQQKLGQANVTMERYAQRIADLEDRLSDTDEGLSQNTQAMAVKIKELYSEVDKLWASAWRRNKAAIEELQKSSSSQGNKLSATEKSLASAQEQLKQASADLARLKSVAGDLERLMSSAKANQAAVDRATETLNRLSGQVAGLAKKVENQEQWLQSIDAFRRQVNGSLTELQGAVRSLQATP